jgi:hypothetical protein
MFPLNWKCRPVTARVFFVLGIGLLATAFGLGMYWLIIGSVDPIPTELEKINQSLQEIRELLRNRS